MTEICRVSPEASAALSVAVIVCAAVFVMKSVAEEPVSAEISMELMVVVGSTVSWLDRTDAWVAALPAVSLASAVTVISPSFTLAQFSSSHIVTDQVPSPAMVPVS